MLKNQEIAKQILELLTSTKNAVPELSNAVKSNNIAVINTIVRDYTDIFTALFDLGKVIANEDKTINLDKHCENLLDSLNRLLEHLFDNPQKALYKLDFEFTPMLQSAYLHFYFWACIFPDSKLMDNYYRNEKKPLTANSYIAESENEGKYKYELSISVLGYNKLDYTKQCVESILATVPRDLNYELILLNHGSIDGTKEYFESLNPTKQVDFKVNGTYGTVLTRIIEGEYAINFSNDTIALPGAIENMLQAMKNEPKLGYAVPSTPYVSNLQTIPADYSTLDEMMAFAVANNQYNPFRHEQRIRLCDPIGAFKSYTTLCEQGWVGHFFADTFSFPDDAAATLIRRAGYKSLLCKDAYCHHFGSVTLAAENQNTQSEDPYTIGRRKFEYAFGIDPWGVGFCYDQHLHEQIKLVDIKQPLILGINSGLGSNPLKIKERYKEEKHNLNALVYNVTSHKNVLEDLRGVSHDVRYEKLIGNIFKTAYNDYPNEFHYIIIDTPVSIFTHYKNLIDNCLKHLKNDGTLCAIFTEALESYLRKEFLQANFIKNHGVNWLIISNADKSIQSD
jgi:hypothetical protein